MSRHDEKPTREPLSDDVTRFVDQLHSSDYFSYVKRLVPVVKGKVVEQTTAGSSGFLLRFTDGRWVASFFDGQVLRYEIGSGLTPAEVVDLLSSPNVGAGSKRLSADLPYADEACDIAAEVSQCEGREVVGLAFGSDCFNFRFPEGRELETMLVPDKNEKVALRVFWEQW